MKRLEELAARAFSEPMTGDLIRRELEAIAASDPSHPMPPLAQSIILGMGRKDVDEMKKFLGRAAQLLAMRSGRAMGEDWQAMEILHDALSAEVTLVEYRPVLDRPARPEDAALRAQAGAKMREALARLEERAREGEDMALFRVLVAALRALSLANAPESDETQSGVAALERIWELAEPASPLAAYFLIFAYRRARKANEAVRVASALLGRHPRGIIPKLVLASTYAATRDYLKAESLVREVSALLPEDPWLSLGRAVLLRRANRMDEARALLGRVRVRPQQDRLKALVDMENRLIRLRVGIAPPR